MALGHVQAQNQLWVLCETPPSLGVIDMFTFDHEELITFSDAGYATDLEIRGDEAIVVLENRVVKVDLLSGQILAEAELLGAQEAALLEDGTVMVTRGGVDDAWQPLELTSHLVWLDGDDLGLEGELLPTEGPTLPSQEITVVDGKVYIAVNNGEAWGQEAGRLGCWNVEEDTYSEWDLGEGAENPVALHVLDGDVFTVNNGIGRARPCLVWPWRTCPTWRPLSWKMCLPAAMRPRLWIPSLPFKFPASTDCGCSTPRPWIGKRKC